jgi:hypothetical protein
MTGQASPPSGPHDAGKQHILREQIDGAAVVKRSGAGSAADRPLTAAHTAVSAIRHVTNPIRLMHGVPSERIPRRRWQ